MTATPKTTAINQKPAEQPKPEKSGDSWRETIESVVVAFVLAFLFRTFEAEAFVIPTGSMAPTLYGQHREIDCEKCGTRFASGVQIESEIRDGKVVHGNRTQYAICPNANCRFPNEVVDREIFAGDRILVVKFPYEFREPERFDVIVFKFPESAKMNYIKRLIGLPGEEIKISNGDIWVKKIADGMGGRFVIARKTPEKQRQLQMLVHDNDNPATELLAGGWPEAWQAREKKSGDAWGECEKSPWAADAEARSFRFDPPTSGAEQEHWIRYANYLPTYSDWARAAKGKGFDSPPQPSTIKDFYAYNSKASVADHDDFVRQGSSSRFDNGFPVGDLTLSCEVEVLAAGGEIVFELVEGKRKYRCTVDLASGKGRFSYHPEFSDEEQFEPALEPFDTGMQQPGRYNVSFANVDDRLCFWVDSKLAQQLEFNDGSKYLPASASASIPNTQADLSPVGIAAKGAQVRISHLLLERDVFYTANPTNNYDTDDKTFALQDDPENDDNDEFFMLGDNSPLSHDSRAWSTQHSVPRHLLTGKAFFVYWPHAVPFMNDGRGYPVMKYMEGSRGDSRDRQGPPIPSFSAPFYPNVGRMHRIR